jgi:hypothetical protein
MKRLVATVLVVFCCAPAPFTGCGGRAAKNTPEPPDASPDAALGDSSTNREPKEHRAYASDCPASRGAFLASPQDCTPDPLSTCVQDADCAQGRNGRCEGRGCLGTCVYDDCFSDSDCAGTAVCSCRASAADWQPNFCAAASNCRIDSDCGQGGYCSPSLIGYSCACAGNGCGQGYFCHTKSDTCTDDADCSSGHCAFDSLEKHFSCADCALLP